MNSENTSASLTAETMREGIRRVMANTEIGDHQYQQAMAELEYLRQAFLQLQKEKK